VADFVTSLSHLLLAIESHPVAACLVVVGGSIALSFAAIRLVVAAMDKK